MKTSPLELFPIQGFSCIVCSKSAGSAMSGHYTETQIGLSELIGSFRSNLKFSAEIGQKNGRKKFFYLDENRKSDSLNSQM